MNYEFFERLNRLIPGSVKIDRENSTVTLTGWNLEEFNNTNQKQDGTKQVEEKASAFNRSPLEGEDSFPKHIFLVNGGCRWVINPLTNSNSDTPECNQSCCSCGVSREHPCSSEKEDKASESDKNLVPGVENKLRQRVLQFFRFLFMAIRKY
ncbi:TPA: hypothetical protein ACTW36_005323 [Klebsiella michiganensis]|uniref:hypothetical protein n=1 Tax=Klebsiella oxytoca TaxID=571 RepID=UPI0007CCCFB0|nr:hypothetical protein [Klebsiella oxytoca]SAQ24064.1 Uncharacterised protein [Klebsiella oxytoca]